MFLVQDAIGMAVWQQPFTALRAPYIFNLRMDPYERTRDEGMGYETWYAEHIYVFVPGQAFVGNYIATYQKYPPRQKPGSFTLDDALSQLQATGDGAN